MAIKEYWTLTKLLILVLVAYTLIPLHNVAFAQKSGGAKNEAAPVEATAGADRNEATIGDKIKFHVRVKYKDNVAIQFPDMGEQLGVFTVKKAGLAEAPEKLSEGGLVAARDFVLSTYEIGRQTIPALKITYRDGQNEGEVSTDEVTIDIKGVIKEGETAGDIKDILPPVAITTSFRRLVLWISIGLGVFLLAGIIYGIISKCKKGAKTPGYQDVSRKPHEIAYELLERLSKENLIARGLIKEYYYRITNILRHYIEDRFHLLAPERTTEEFLTEVAHTNKLEETHKTLIREFLVRCDMVKYAKYGPSGLEIKETYDAAKKFIDETKELREEKEVVADKK